MLYLCKLGRKIRSLYNLRRIDFCILFLNVIMIIICENAATYGTQKNIHHYMTCITLKLLISAMNINDIFKK